MRPSNVDLDADWRSIDYCAIDVETTGLNLRQDEIISLGSALIHDARVKAAGNFYREVRPRRLPSVASIRVHGLRSIDLENALSLEEIIPDFAAQIGGRVVIAHAAWIERAFLQPHLRRTGLAFSKLMIDTAALARAAGYAQEGNGREPSLEFLARRLNLPAYAPHNALGDALTTAVVFLALATRLERVQLAANSSVLSLRVLLETSAQNEILR
jgi:DNA polymerase-3 subunit epsilon